MRGDLHCHTKLSDGSLGIEDLITLAKKRGIEAIAITDHDCLAGTVRGKIIGDRFGVQVIPGVELSATDSKTGKKVHLLCYLPELTQELRAFCAEMARRRNEATAKSIAELEKRYPQFTRDAVLEITKRSGVTYKTHIIRVLYEYGYTDGIYKDLYRELFGKGGSVLHDPAYDSVDDVLAMVHRSKGVAVLAHPSVYNSMELAQELGEKELLDGVEIDHPRNRIDDQQTLRQMAQKYGWIITGGSDFHGMHMSKPAPLGACVTQDSQRQALLDRSSQKRELQK